MHEIESFKRHIDLTINILQTRDALIVETFKQGLYNNLEPEYARDVETGALYHLAEADPDTFFWTLHQSDAALHLHICREAVTWAASILICQGFVPGEDFSALPEGKLLVKAEIKHVLSNPNAAFLALVLREILQVAVTPTDAD